MRPAARSSIQITEIDLGMARSLNNYVFNAPLNYMQYKLAFTRHICIEFKTNISNCFVIY